MVQILVFADLNYMALGPAVSGAVWLNLLLGGARHVRGNVFIEIVGLLRLNRPQLALIFHQESQRVQQRPELFLKRQMLLALALISVLEEFATGAELVIDTLLDLSHQLTLAEALWHNSQGWVLLRGHRPRQPD